MDLLAIGLLFAALIVACLGGYHGEWFGVRISVRSPERLVAVALLLMAIRHRRVRHPSLWERLQQAPEWTGITAPLATDDTRCPNLMGRPGELALASSFFVVLAALSTYPQVARLDSVADLGDPLFSTWRLAWIAHQLPRDPLHLFDANTFYPERLTLTYSDAMVVPGIMVAPLVWLGVPPLYVCNLVLLASLACSGVAMFVLVRALTGRPGAALVAGTIFALYPYRFEHYAHLELQLTLWMPLILLAVHRMFRSGARRDGMLFGLLVALQTLSSLYYGAFLMVYLAPLVFALAVRSPVRWHAARALGTGVVIAAVLVAPVAGAYIANRSLVGERHAAEVAHFSAMPQDYLKPHERSRYHAAWDSGPRRPERQLFPTLSPFVLSVVGMWPPLSAARIGYVTALIVSFEASRGTNGALYRTLRAYVPPFRGLRAPARFSVMVGLTLSILAGYGAARLFRSGSGAARLLATAAFVGIAMWEMTPRLDLVRAWTRPPAIYESLEGAKGVVLAEFPMPDPRRPDDARATYFSVFHWHKIVNGISGHYPTSYIQLLASLRNFPDERSFDALRRRGVTHVAVHGAFYQEGRFRTLIRGLDGRRDVDLVTTAPFEGSESRLYRLR